ncbi:peroxidase [Marchantia polymorpha subsp. ruderalis]|uniref:Peroxidase n=3 Tax=Marchantia polymorpha TaxID=3197 RepID=A0AAF6BI30_MARPO|nr:hypothetical protein MARPO_0032s0069 [Marchantia polymorpha]BBN11664.1 hypothetical protein Mp_5g13790 [Marchantia polymorpha subsp. ruderalis]|eukprot:PTQ41878.1 hypothetical protein MARPO_0032s0069 [Marchantia polymorpha]
MVAQIQSSMLLVIGLAVAFATMGHAQLSETYYAKTCPGGAQAVAQVVNDAVRSDRRNAAALLKLQFVDCFVLGCDASILLASTKYNVAERDALPNRNLRGFWIIDQAKAALERICPEVVSCADIVALAARDAITAIGGPRWKVPLGRRDGSTSRERNAVINLPRHNMTYTQLWDNFRKYGFSEAEMIALSGAHTIGVTPCSGVTPRIYNYPGSASGADPYLNSSYVWERRWMCPNSLSTAKNLVALDVSRGGQTFDTNYYANVLQHKAVFKADDALISTWNGRNKVLDLSKSQSKFFSEFALAMEKLGRLKVTFAPYGQVRKFCSRRYGE